MKRVFTCIALIFIATLSFCPVNGQTTIDAELRPRVEYREGFRKPLADSLNAAFVTVQRTRLNFDYKSKVLISRLSLQDVHIWGSSDTKTNASSLAFYEAWAEYLISSGASVKFGRQPLKYDDQRLLAAPDWSATGASHDVLVFKYKTPKFQVHTGMAYNNAKDTVVDVAYSYALIKIYKTMGYAWLSKDIFKGITLTAIGIAEGFESATSYQTDYARITYGGNLVYANDSSTWSGILTGYFQQGKDMTKASGIGYADLNSSFFAAKVIYKFTKKYAVTLGTDYYSGSASSIEADKSTTFNRLYGATHSFNGSMEYFVKLPSQGLFDYYGSIKTVITPKLSADLGAHAFYFDEDFYYKTEKQSKNLGSEIDIKSDYIVSKEFSIQAGYSRYFNSTTTKKYFKMDGVETRPEQWAYMMVSIKPQFYKTPALPESK